MVEIPRPKIIYTANERSEMAHKRLLEVLDRWTEEVGKTNLVAGGMPAGAVRPFEVDSSNLAGEAASKSTNIWSRMLPVLLLLWAMTGAFYPAVDLCAGEKERGTLETLLSSPAERSEIVLGKLLTIMAFSMITAALNLVSVGITGCLIFRQMANFGGPPPLAVLWLSLALVPVSALFSALCLALASFARSTKEGQYYLMPLLMLSLPMAVLPMSPGVELNLGNSLIPISGVVLLLKALLEGSYLQALQYLPIVLAVTMAACWLAVRWAVEQFNKESVLFRESERFAVGLWLRHLMRDRGPTPSAAEGLFCGVMILVRELHLPFCGDGAAGFRRFRPRDPGVATGRDPYAGAVDGGGPYEQSAADAAAAAAALEDDSRGCGTGGGHAPVHHGAERTGHASLPHGPRDDAGCGQVANPVRLGRPGFAGPVCGRGAGPV